MEPRFRKRSDGNLNMCDSSAALKVREENKKRTWSRALSPDKVSESARRAVLCQGDDPGNKIYLSGQHEIQFGAFRGQTFKWLAENALGYAGYLVASIKRETSEVKDNRNHRANKEAFQEYIELFPEGYEAIRVKTLNMDSNSSQHTPVSKESCSSTQSSPLVSSVRSLLAGKTCNPQSLDKTVRRLFTSPVAQPNLVARSTKPQPTLPACGTLNQDDRELIEQADFLESQVSSKRVCLPVGWTNTLPSADQNWVSKALFKWSAQNQPELDYTKVDRMWWYPPQCRFTITGVPVTECYFGHPFFLWMPRKLWRVKLTCPHSDCVKEELTSTGLHQEIRQVIAVETSYFMASEYLSCRRCKRRVISWSFDIVSQLDVSHRLQFPCILTLKLACDMRVVRLLRQRGLGNSSSQIQKKLEEQHSETWLQKTIQYLTDCQSLCGAVTSGLVSPVSFQDPPAMLDVPKHRWLMQVYALDVLQRLDEIKASITSQFGRVLKLYSTKIVSCKLAGHSAGTSTWVTNVGNEYGQVIMSVLTASEGFGLAPMAAGIIKRYRDAGVPPPELLYVDRDCCGSTYLKKMFEEWTNMEVRLDIWHFMRRIAVGCTTDSHQLYATFMARLSRCIFMWDQEDLHRFIVAKRAELESQLMQPSHDDVLRRRSKNELALHCKRKTCGTTETVDLITQLIQSFEGERGRDTLGVSLINSDRMSEIWKSQKKHVACIQDHTGLQLYVQTGTLQKGGYVLPTYRSARGSTSLESFHLHLNRFIPGTLASETFFQAYLLDGLARWNEDRASAATSEGMVLHSGLTATELLKLCS
ncbi:uncharacterized protein LOC130554003 [Triplophysa rosa]|uniref:uncharacterized protein LOC130554003 n=1 Tax=Triplophysa rosa TaxID=992332 RepID=UPI0025462EA2|nr:uncharacterized protein LOC130554003 [Triplophysa rosa]